MTWATAVIEALVGVSCLAMAGPYWKRGTVLFRAVGVVLGVAGAVAIANAVVSMYAA